MKTSHAILLISVSISPAACSLFETRSPEEPSQSGCDYRPPTAHGDVLINLQNAIAQKCVDTYSSCFADPSRTSRPYTFTPAAEASAQYPSVFTSWTFAEEQSYFRNLVARKRQNGFANLLLTPKDSVITADSVTYSFDYTLTFEHTETGFPSTARGNFQLTLGTDNNNFWVIYRWIDFKTTDDISWSSFKGKFSD